MVTAKQRNVFNYLSGELQMLETKAHQAELPELAQELNKAKNAVGWAFANLLANDKSVQCQCGKHRLDTPQTQITQGPTTHRAKPQLCVRKYRIKK